MQSYRDVIKQHFERSPNAMRYLNLEFLFVGGGLCLYIIGALMELLLYGNMYIFGGVLAVIGMWAFLLGLVIAFIKKDDMVIVYSCAVMAVYELFDFIFGATAIYYYAEIYALVNAIFFGVLALFAYRFSERGRAKQAYRLQQAQMTQQHMAQQQMGMPPQAAPGQAMPPQGMPAQGVSPQGVTPQGVVQQGVAPQGMAQQGVTQQGLSAQEIPRQAMSPQAVPAQGVSAQGIPTQGAAQQAVSVQGVPQQAAPQAVSQQAAQRQGTVKPTQPVDSADDNPTTMFNAANKANSAADSIVCPKCAAHCQSNSAFCENCGAKLVSS